MKVKIKFVTVNIKVLLHIIKERLFPIFLTLSIFIFSLILWYAQWIIIALVLFGFFVILYGYLLKELKEDYNKTKDTDIKYLNNGTNLVGHQFYKSESYVGWRLRDWYANTIESYRIRLTAGRLYGRQEEYYSNKQVCQELEYQDNQLHGNCIMYYPDGSIFRESIYKNGKLEEAKEYDRNSKIHFTQKGTLFNFYDTHGVLMFEIHLNADDLIYSAEYINEWKIYRKDGILDYTLNFADEDTQHHTNSVVKTKYGEDQEIIYSKIMRYSFPNSGNHALFTEDFYHWRGIYSKTKVVASHIRVMGGPGTKQPEEKEITFERINNLEQLITLNPIDTLSKEFKESLDEVVNERLVHKILMFDPTLYETKYQVEFEQWNIQFWWDNLQERISGSLTINKEKDFNIDTEKGLEYLKEWVWGHADEYGKKYLDSEEELKKTKAAVRIIVFGHIYGIYNKLKREVDFLSLSDLYREKFEAGRFHAKASVYGAVKFALFSGIRKSDIIEWFPLFEDDDDLIQGVNGLEQQILNLINKDENDYNTYFEKLKSIFDGKERVPIYELNESQRAKAPGWFKGPFYTEGDDIYSQSKGEFIYLTAIEKSIYTEIKYQSMLIERLAQSGKVMFESIPYVSDITNIVNKGTEWFKKSNPGAYDYLIKENESKVLEEEKKNTDLTLGSRAPEKKVVKEEKMAELKNGKTRTIITHEIMTKGGFTFELNDGKIIEVSGQRHTLVSVEEYYEDGEWHQGDRDEIDDFHLTGYEEGYRYSENDICELFDIEDYGDWDYNGFSNDWCGIEEGDSDKIRHEKWEDYKSQFARIKSKDQFNVL